MGNGVFHVDSPCFKHLLWASQTLWQHLILTCGSSRVPGCALVCTGCEPLKGQSPRYKAVPKVAHHTTHTRHTGFRSAPPSDTATLTQWLQSLWLRVWVLLSEQKAAFLRLGQRCVAAPRAGAQCAMLVTPVGEEHTGLGKTEGGGLACVSYPQLFSIFVRI